MKYQIIFLLVNAILLSCNSTATKNTDDNTSKSELYIQTITAIGTGDKQKITKSITAIDSDYFEVSLSSFGNVNPSTSGETGFRAGKEIESPKIGVEFKSVFFDITDKEGVILEFKTSTEFLNFMSEKGYEMVDQIKSKYRTDYTFKKK